jgi:hypothetical protein
MAYDRKPQAQTTKTARRGAIRLTKTFEDGGRNAGFDTLTRYL